MTYRFCANRVSGDGNALFPDELIIDTSNKRVTFRKGKIIGHNEKCINFSAIGSVSKNVHLFFADIIIETKGGLIICAKGFTRSDASKISNLLSDSISEIY